MNWKKSTLESIYYSDEWRKRMNEKYIRFPELREGINFYLDYLSENLKIDLNDVKGKTKK